MLPQVSSFNRGPNLQNWQTQVLFVLAKEEVVRRHRHHGPRHQLAASPERRTSQHFPHPLHHRRIGSAEPEPLQVTKVVNGAFRWGRPPAPPRKGLCSPGYGRGPGPAGTQATVTEPNNGFTSGVMGSHHGLVAEHLVDRLDELAQVFLSVPPLAQAVPLLFEDPRRDARALRRLDLQPLPGFPAHGPFLMEVAALAEGHGHQDQPATGDRLRGLFRARRPRRRPRIASGVFLQTR